MKVKIIQHLMIAILYDYNNFLSDQFKDKLEENFRPYDVIYLPEVKEISLD